MNNNLEEIIQFSFDKKFMKIVICGSMIFSKEMVKVVNILKKDSHKVILPHNAKKYADEILANETSYESIKNKIDNNLIRDYFNEIKNADAVLVINIEKNKIKDYIGGNSFLEIGFAHILNKKIFLFNQIPQMIYTDEIKAMQPIVLNEDLNKIK